MKRPLTHRIALYTILCIVLPLLSATLTCAQDIVLDICSESEFGYYDGDLSTFSVSGAGNAVSNYSSISFDNDAGGVSTVFFCDELTEESGTFTVIDDVDGNGNDLLIQLFDGGQCESSIATTLTVNIEDTFQSCDDLEIEVMDTGSPSLSPIVLVTSSANSYATICQDTTVVLDGGGSGTTFITDIGSNCSSSDPSDLFEFYVATVVSGSNDNQVNKITDPQSASLFVAQSQAESICVAVGQSMANVDLTSYSFTTPGVPSGTIATFYTDQTSAENENGANEITSPGSYNTTGGQVWVRLELPTGCFEVVSLSLTVVEEADVTNSSSTECFGDGVDIDIVGGAPPYDLNIDVDGSPETITISGVPYTYQVSDTGLSSGDIISIESIERAGCVNDFTDIEITVDRPSIGVSSSTVCAGEDFDVTVDGIGPYTTFAPTTGITLNENGNSPGTYSATADSFVGADIQAGFNLVTVNGCTINAPQLVNINSLSDITIDETGFVCGDGSVEVTIAGGGSPYTITGTDDNGEWTESEPSGNSISIPASGINGDDVIIQSVTNDSGCSNSTPFTIPIDNAAVSIDESAVCEGGQITVNFDGLGEIDVTETGSTFFSSTVSEGTETVDIDDLSDVVEYQITLVSTSNGCTAGPTGTITLNPQPDFSQSSTEFSDCANLEQQLGIILQFVDSENPWDYDWDNSDIDLVIEEVGGEFVVSLTDSNLENDESTTVTFTANALDQCDPSDHEFDVTFFATPDLGSFDQTDICLDSATPLIYNPDDNVTSADFTINGNVTSYTGLDGTPLEVNIEGIEPTTEVMVEISSGEGCGNDGSIDVNLLPIPELNDLTVILSIDGVPDNTFCNGDSNIDITAPEDNDFSVSNFDYTWTPPSGITMSDQDGNEVTIASINDAGGQIMVVSTADYGNGFTCSAEYAIPINIEGERAGISVFEFPGGIFVAELDSAVTNEQPQYDWITVDDTDIEPAGDDGDQHILVLPPELGYNGDIELRASYYSDARCLSSFIIDVVNIVSEEVEVRSFPNPIQHSDRLTVMLPAYFSGENIVLSLYDVSGRLAFEHAFFDTQPLLWVDIPSSMKGTYSLRITSPGHVATDKIVVR